MEQIDRMKEGVIEKRRWKGRDRESSLKKKQQTVERKERALFREGEKRKDEVVA